MNPATHESSPDYPPHYEDIIKQDEGFSAAGKVNKGYDYSEGSQVKVSVISDPGKSSKMAESIEVEDEDPLSLTPEEEQMLSVLREVVRKCTHANPSKRPSAAEVLKMLKTVEIPELDEEKVDLGGDDDVDD